MLENLTLLNNEIKIYDINFKYRKYLYQFDQKVNLKHNRHFSSIVVVMDNIHYFIPLTSHPLRKNGKRRNPRTTIEIFNESKELIAALLINNMIPVSDNDYQLVNISNDKDKDYLNSEIIYLRKESVKNELIRKVKNVRGAVIVRKDPFLISFCCNFLLLEQKMKEWNNK